MALLIKGMEMPTRCCECRLSTCHSFKERPLCDVLVEYMSYGEWEAKRLDNCPLVPVPEHGDLVDKQLMAETNEQHYKIVEGEPGADYARKVVLCMLDQVPTVIPASGE